MIFVSMVLQANPKMGDTLVQAMTQMMDETRKEKGCVVYTYSRDMENDDVFHLSEMWENEPLMEAHIDAPHAAIFVAALAEAGKIIAVKAFNGDVEKYRIRAPSA